MNKLGRRVLDTLECHTAVSLLHSCPWSLEPVRAVVNIHMLSIHRSRLQAASLDREYPMFSLFSVLDDALNAILELLWVLEESLGSMTSQALSW